MGAPTSSAPAPSISTSLAAGAVPADSDWLPERERIVSDVETLKALSEPLRLRILETMCSRLDGDWSVKELATAIGVPQTRLYHHIDLLLERDLIRPAAQRIVSGIIETRYRVAALSLRLDPALLTGEGEAGAEASAVITSVFDGARTDLARALRNAATAASGAEAPDRPLLTRGLAKVTPARAAELRARLEAMLGEFDADDTEPATRAYGFVVAMYPIAITATESDDD